MSSPSYFDPLRRSLRNWLRRRKRVLSTELPAPFFYARDINAVHEYLAQYNDELNEFAASPRGLEGRCYPCDEDVTFSIDVPQDGGQVNWRETLVCPKCGLINRWRSCLHVFEVVCEPTENDRIYLTETLSPVYKILAGRYPLLSSSEYFPDHEFGKTVQTHVAPVRNEDVTQLSFADASQDIILTFDVLEHVPDYRSALREFHRVLGAGGQLVISVPFSFRQETLVRATRDDDGHITHLVEPCYHGDPLSESGVLSYYDFGMELLDELREAGFDECFLVLYSSREWAYPGGNVVFIARKLKSGNAKFA